MTVFRVLAVYAALQPLTIAVGRDDLVAGACGSCSLQYSYAHISIWKYINCMRDMPGMARPNRFA